MVTEEQEQTQAAVQMKQSGNTWRGVILVVVVFLAVLAYFIFTGIHARAAAEQTLAKDTVRSAEPTVSLVQPVTTSGAEEVVLPGNMQAYTETPIWARSSGYLKKWYVDIGDHVKQGQLLAELEAPELDHQLQQAREQVITDQENLKLAEITADRYQGLLKTDSIAKQDVDTAVQNAAARTATVRSSQANVARVEQLVGYEKVYAPFDGVITARNVDTGALVDAGSNTPGKELFRAASTNTLRVYINVPEAYSQAAKPGVNSYLTLNEFPGRQFRGKVVRNSDAIDVSSRTLLVEVDVPNPTGELLPGSYVSVHLKLPSKVQAVTVPVNTLLFRSAGLQVALVRDGHVALVPVTIGRDYGDSVEILHGVTPSEKVIVNPSDSIEDGEQVQVSQGAPGSAK